MVTLRPLVETDADGPYLEWMGDAETLRYLEARFEAWDRRKLILYIKRQRKLNNPFFAILKDGVHVGNLKLTVNPNHSFAEVGVLVGRSHWGQGIASAAIQQAADYAFSQFDLHKLWAGTYSENKAAEKAFLKAGFQREAVLKSQYLCDGTYTDDLIVVRFNPNGH